MFTLMKHQMYEQSVTKTADGTGRTRLEFGAQPAHHQLRPRLQKTFRVWGLGATKPVREGVHFASYHGCA